MKSIGYSKKTHGSKNTQFKNKSRWLRNKHYGGATDTTKQSTPPKKKSSTKKLTLAKKETKASTKKSTSPTKKKQKASTKKSTPSSNSLSMDTVEIVDGVAAANIYTFLSHSCNFINMPKSNNNNNELRTGRKKVPKNCIIITYGDIGNVNYNDDQLFYEFLDMFKKGHKYFKTPLNYEKELTKIFGKKLHFHYSNYYGTKPPNKNKQFYADIKYDNNTLFRNVFSDNGLIENFNWLVVLNTKVDEKRNEIAETNYNITKQAQLSIFTKYITNFDVNVETLAGFIDNNNITGYIDYLKQSLNPYRLLKTGLYKLGENLLITDKANYYLTHSQIKDMFNASLIKTEFKFDDDPKYDNIPISTLLTKLQPHPVNIKQSDLFEKHPGIYYNFTCRSSCEDVTDSVIHIQRQFSDEGAENNI